VILSFKSGEIFVVRSLEDLVDNNLDLGPNFRGEYCPNFISSIFKSSLVDMELP